MIVECPNGFYYLIWNWHQPSINRFLQVSALVWLSVARPLPIYTIYPIISGCSLGFVLFSHAGVPVWFIWTVCLYSLGQFTCQSANFINAPIAITWLHNDREIERYEVYKIHQTEHIEIYMLTICIIWLQRQTNCCYVINHNEERYMVKQRTCTIHVYYIWLSLAAVYVEFCISVWTWQPVFFLSCRDKRDIVRHWSPNTIFIEPVVIAGISK